VDPWPWPKDARTRHIAQILLLAGVLIGRPTIFLKAAGRVEVVHLQDTNERTEVQEVTRITSDDRMNNDGST
jgi:hypothetical protein